MLRFLYIIFLLVKYSFIYFLLKFGWYRKPKQKILRNFFEEAGGSFIKFGQILASRADFLPEEYALEMINLFDNVKPFPYDQVENIFLQELGATPQKIFKDFQKIPFASASFGQVHGAKLEDGHIVAVKVLRPGIEEKVKVDFFIVSVFAFFADLFFKIDAFPWKEFAREFKKWTKKELDYRIEAENIKKMYKNTSVNKSIVMPNVYLHLTTKKILVEDYIEGIPLSRALRGLKDGRLTPEKLKKMGIDIKKVPSIFTQELLREFFMDDVFHADPHPGNILLLKQDRIALLDFGIVGEPVSYNKASFVKFMKSGATPVNVKQAVYHFSNLTSGELKNMIGSALPATVSQKRVDEFINFLSNNFAESLSEVANQSLKEINDMKKDYIAIFLRGIKLGSQFKVKLPKEAALFIRTLSIWGFLAKNLNNEFRISNEIRDFFAIHPEKTLLQESDYAPTYIRINREVAIEQLNNWLSYLMEIDPPLYQLVKEKFKEYNAIDS